MFRLCHTIASNHLLVLASSKRWLPSCLLLSSTICPYHTIEAIPRENWSVKYYERERYRGRTPAQVFSVIPIKGSESILSNSKKLTHRVTIATRDLKSILETVHFQSFFATVFMLEIRAGPGSRLLLDSGTVIPIDAPEDKETGEILFMEFRWVYEGEKVNINIPYIFEGQDDCPGIEKGGVLKNRKSLECWCPIDKIPPSITVDISNLKIGNKVFEDQLNLDPSISLSEDSTKKFVCEIVDPSSISLDPE